VINGLLALLKDEESGVRQDAAVELALVELGRSDDVVINVFLALLKDESRRRRGRAARVLFKLGRRNDYVIDGLLRLSVDSKSGAHACDVLIKFGLSQEEIKTRADALRLKEEVGDTIEVEYHSSVLPNLTSASATAASCLTPLSSSFSKASNPLITVLSLYPN